MSAHLRTTGLMLALVAAGCADREAEPLAVVRGRVTYRGAPLPGGLVVFTPDDDYGSRGPQAEGAVGTDGRFFLSTAGKTGAAAGKYRVTVVGADGWPLPAKFMDPNQSGLRAEVIAGRENVLDFKLEEK